jgi:hypothetical protein
MDGYYYYYCWSCPDGSTPIRCGGYDSIGPYDATTNPNGHCLVTTWNGCAHCGDSCNCGTNQVAIDTLYYTVQRAALVRNQSLVNNQLITYAAPPPPRVPPKKNPISDGASDDGENLDFTIADSSLLSSGYINKSGPFLSYFTDPGQKNKLLGVKLWDITWMNPGESSENTLDRTLRIGVMTKSKNADQQIGAEYYSNDTLAYHINYQGYLYAVLLKHGSPHG